MLVVGLNAVAARGSSPAGGQPSAAASCPRPNRKPAPSHAYLVARCLRGTWLAYGLEGPVDTLPRVTAHKQTRELDTAQKGEERASVALPDCCETVGAAGWRRMPSLLYWKQLPRVKLRLADIH